MWGLPKRKFGEPGEAERLFRLMDIDGICHSAFCGRLEARFPGRAIAYTTSPGFGLAKPDKSRLFAPNCPQQTSFSVHFLFSAACELWRHSRAVFCPVGFGTNTPPQTSQRFKSLSGKSPLPASRPAARPPSGTTYSRPRKKSSADRCRCPHRQGQCSCRPHSNSTPGVSGWPPVFSAPGSCGKGNRPACVPAAASLYRGYSLMRSLHFAFRCRSPRKGFLPHSCGVFRRWHAPSQLRDILSRSPTLCGASPAGGIPFRTVILFSRCRPSMNYPKSTRKMQFPEYCENCILMKFTL